MPDVHHALLDVGLTVRNPEELARRWQGRHERDDSPSPWIFGALLLTAVAGTVVYGLTMKLHAGFASMLLGALTMPACAGAAWSLAVPSLYIVNRTRGSEVDLSTTLLVALVTVAFGSLAMLASVPVTWFFTLALPFEAARWLVNIVVFTGVGFCMSDVFRRTMIAVDGDGDTLFHFVWLGLLTIVGSELFYLSGLFDFSA